MAEKLNTWKGKLSNIIDSIQYHCKAKGTTSERLLDNSSTWRDYDKAKCHINQIIQLSTISKINKGKTKKKYAVLIASTNQRQDLENITIAYDTLLQAGYTDETVLVYVPKKKKLKERENIVDYSAEKSEIWEGFKTLADKVTEEDEFLLLYSGHSDGDSLLIHDKYVSKGELENLLSPICSGKTILVFDCCFSGAFSERFGKGKTIAISVSKKNKVSSTTSRFTRDLFLALRNNQGDTKRDAKTSLKEAFIYAAENDPMQNRTHWCSRFFGLRQVPNLQYQNLNPEQVYFQKLEGGNNSETNL